MAKENEEPTDDDLFNEATSDEPAEPVVAAEVEQPEPEAEVVAEAVADADKPDPALADDRIPKWRRAEMAEARRKAETEATEARQALATERAEKVELKRRLDALEKPVPKVEDEVDPLIDPKAYREQIKKELREEILNDRREASLQAAHKTYKAEFEDAYKLAGERVDLALKAKMQGSRDPGETLMQWYREQKTVQEIGGDLTAYKQRLRDEALKDPEFRKAAMEAWRTGAAPAQPNGRPKIDLPPSLNGASRANAALNSATDDVSDEQLFQEITAA